MDPKAIVAILNLCLALFAVTLRIVILIWFYYAISDIRQDVHSLTWEGKQCQLPTIPGEKHE